MCASNTLIGVWASGIWSDLGEPATLSALTISGYAVQPSTLGSLNIKIGTCYSGTGYMGTGITFDAVPDLTNRELAIIEGMFLVGWYRRLSQATMGLGGDTIPWARIAEGDESIARARPESIGKEYREMAKEANLILNYLVSTYVDQDRGTSVSVDYLNPAFPYSANNAYGTNQRARPGPGI